MSVQTIATFLRTVARGEPAPRGPDGGYLVPRHFYSYILEVSKKPTSPPLRPNTRIYAIAPLENARLLAGDEMAARDCLTVLLEALAMKAPPEVLRSRPLELEASGEATYKAHNGKLVNAFEADLIVFRLSVHTPGEHSSTTHLGTAHARSAQGER